MRAAQIAIAITVLAAAAAASCPQWGDSSEARIRALDFFKNRTKPPTTVDPAITLAAILAAGNDTNRFSTAQAATIHGYLIDIKRGGRESCNCHSPTDRDWHIEIAATPDAPATQRMIVEVTPRMTLPNWTLFKVAVQNGSLIEVTGWMFYDEEHKQNASLSNPGGTDLWRATAWEIHPVSEVKLIK